MAVTHVDMVRNGSLVVLVLVVLTGDVAAFLVRGSDDSLSIEGSLQMIDRTCRLKVGDPSQRSMTSVVLRRLDAFLLEVAAVVPLAVGAFNSR